MSVDYDSHVPLEGSRATESAHRKIELQSLADLTYLIANVSRAARAKIDQNLPPDAEAATADDPMRRRVEVLVDEYIRQTFHEAKSSISINGMDTREMEAELEKAQEGEELEPFDSKLAQRVQALAAQVESQTLQLANLRREAPQMTAQNFMKAFEKQSAEFETRSKADRERRLEEARATEMNVGEIQRVDEMQSAYQKGSDDLQEFGKGVGGTTAKMEKARRAADVVGEK